MNDRFKFRVWSKKYNKFIEDNRYPIGSDFQLIITQSGDLIKLVLGDFEDDYEDSYSWANFNNYEQDCIVMQSTGLKDKNGKLIYESDIVKVKEKDSSLSKIQIAEIQYKPKYTAFVVLLEGVFGYLYNESLNDLEIEVIGNIYEDKDLLNENS